MQVKHDLIGIIKYHLAWLRHCNAKPIITHALKHWQSTSGTEMIILGIVINDLLTQ
jgi:hypothetical protein